MRKETAKTGIPKRVREAVYARDGGRCIICGSRRGLPNAHYISRAQGGLGIERNIVTLCPDCHRAYDQSGGRRAYRRLIQAHLMAFYPDMREEDLIYRKEDGYGTDYH